jgi:steroid 5-alpha reductase family enzyme
MGSILAVNAALLFILIIGLWLYSLTIKDVSFIDAFWAFGMVILTVSTFIQLGSPGDLRPMLITGLTAIWGLRLSIHLYTRWRAHGIDPRYARIMGGLMEKKGWSFGKASLLQVFLLQAPLLYIVCLPAQLGQMETTVPLGPLAILGTIIALIGIAFESIGDAQLKAFKSHPSNKGKVLDSGLWRYTRHPNYFGDCCTWWGIYLVAAETITGLMSLPGPLLLTFLLMKWSGVPLLERGLAKTKPGYAEYIARTSSFFPWPPKSSK